MPQNMNKEQTFLFINTVNNSTCENVYNAFMKTYMKNPKNAVYRPFAYLYAACLGHAQNDPRIVQNIPPPAILNVRCEILRMLIK
jgi:hypothetical protein